MYEIELAEPSKELEIPAMKYRQEHIDSGESWINGSCSFMKYSSYDEWLTRVAQTKNAGTSHFGVSATTYFSIRKSDNRIIGSIQLRHDLTPELKTSGGHIGYNIRPSERKNGYGKQQLMLVLDVARQIKISKVMISCDKDNIASSATALICGGVLACENLHEGKLQQIFWIDLRQ
ncbi:MAG: GNAT family N-acetyltransferase [Oscillospiraceae bacterium]